MSSTSSSIEYMYDVCGISLLLEIGNSLYCSTALVNTFPFEYSNHRDERICIRRDNMKPLLPQLLGTRSDNSSQLYDIYVKIMSRVERYYTPLGLPSAASSKHRLF